MSKNPIGLFLVIIGAIVLGYGFYASESVASEISKLFTGTPTDRTMYLLGAGAITLIAGIFLMLGNPRRSLP